LIIVVLLRANAENVTLLKVCVLVCVWSVLLKPIVGGGWFGSWGATIAGASRGLLSLLMIWSSLYALARMPIAEVYGIRYSAPILVLIASRALLRERVSLVASLSIACGMIGIVLIYPLEGGSDAIGYAAAICSAAASAASMVLVRRWREESTPFADVFISMVVSVVVLAP
jgi:S-adenosylmethionine uptake transporter